MKTIGNILWFVLSGLWLAIGYFLAGQGLLVIALAAVATFVNRQDAIDLWHGANEDT